MLDLFSEWGQGGRGFRVDNISYGNNWETNYLRSLNNFRAGLNYPQDDLVFGLSIYELPLLN